MKKYLIGLLAVCAPLLAEDDDNDPFKPEVFADISEEAQENQVSMDGARTVCGVEFAQMSCSAGVVDAATTKNTFNLIGLLLGAEYSKTFKEKFLVGGGSIVDLRLAKKKEGNWSNINQGYADKRGNYANQKARMETPIAVPEFFLKGGLVVPKKKVLIYVKGGFAIMNIEATYWSNNVQVDKVNSTIVSPYFAIGGEKKFSGKFGAAAELSFFLSKGKDKNIPIAANQSITHKTEAKQFCLRAFVTCTMK